MRKLTIPPGIGDAIFLLEKLANTGEQFDFVVPDALPQRSHQLQPLLPSVINSVTYGPNLKYKTINENSIHKTKKRWSNIASPEFFLSANQHLEDGRRIEEFLPDLNTSFQLNYLTTDDNKLDAEILLPNSGRYIGIYTSAYSTTRNWGFWDEKEWFRLIEMIHEMDEDFIFVIIGAKWDVDLSSKLVSLLHDAQIPYVKLIDQELGMVLECMRRFTYAFYFPSGLPILSETGGGSDCTMFYPPKQLPRMPGTWCDLKRKQSGEFKECFFCEPIAIFEWVRDVYFLFERV